MKHLQKDQAGLGHLLLLVIIVAVVGGVGFVGYTVMQKNKDKASTTSSSKVSSEVSKAMAESCKKEIDDKDLCKFFSSWDGNLKFAVVSTDTSDGTTTSMTMKIDGKNTYIKSEGASAMEIITIGDTTYTKGGQYWWKQTTDTNSTQETSSTIKPEDFDFDVPTEDELDTAGAEYKKLGKEACGSFTCFKYQFIDSTNTSTKQFLWFDDEDYRMRKLSIENADGSKSEQVYSYDNVSVTVPSPVKELGPNQYIVPGESEPMTMPDMSNYTE
ncbi:hypothetical protein JNM87_01650 [Candidatus Saccharibacteria bacterium]|nr:hypothetical protein [Candidatus Saccharibacteria bacterium]